MEENNFYQANAPENNLKPQEEIIQRADPIELDIEDEKLIKILDKNIKESKKFFEREYDLVTRQKKNEIYLFGRQVGQKEKNNEYKKYESRFQDNAIYEIEASLKPLAMSRLPDIIVTPPNEDPEKVKTAADLSKVLDNDIKNRDNRLAAGMAFKHHPVYFIGVIKCVWRPELKDFKFQAVHPSYIELDHTCQSNNADDMMWIAETLPITVQECLIRFPGKRDALFEELKNEGLVGKDQDDFKDKDLATEIKIKEIWFKWQKPTKTEEEFEEVNGVIWKFKKCILKKIKNPNYDWEGEEKYYSYGNIADESTKQEVKPADLMAAMMGGMQIPNLQKETVYRNYFECARFPYFFVGYDQWHKVAYDETSRIEQNIRNQESLDETGKIILDKLKSRKKHIWSAEGLEGKDIENLDMDDPKQDIKVQGDVNKIHAEINQDPPTAQEFNYIQECRNRMYGVAGANAIRGEVQSDVATTNQIAREADYTRADDLVEDTVNAAYEWMAQWSLQMIKLRYTEAHFRKVLGAKGQVTFFKLRHDMIEDGMEVMIKASGTDKIKIKNQANETVKAGFGDPLSYFEDIGASNPEERTQRMMLFSTNPTEYLLKYVMGVEGVQGMATALNGQPPMGQPQAPQGALPPPNQQPSPDNTGNVAVEPPPPPQAGGMI